MTEAHSDRVTRQSDIKVRLGPAGVHIFNRGTGLNVLLDEVKIPTGQWDKAPRQVSIALTTVCDLDCPHCFAPKSPAILDLHNILGWLDDLDVNGCLGVGFGGGEPTLHPDILEICRYASEKTGLAVTLTSHGHNFTDEMIESLSGRVHFMRISMDGVGSTYENIRGRPFQDLLGSIEKISTIAPFGINYLVNSLTIPDLDCAADLAANMGASELLLLPEQPTEYGEGIDKSSDVAFKDWIRSYRGKIPLTISETGSGGISTCDPCAIEGALGSYAHIDASGSIKQTSFDDNGVAIGTDGVMIALRNLKMMYEMESL